MRNRILSFFSVKPESWAIMKRMGARSVFLFILTAIALCVADMMVDSGIGNRFALVRRFPEFIPMMMAAAQFTFIEMSLFWIRFGTQPKNDVQEAIEVANTQPMSAAIVHITNSLVWFARICVFLYLLHPTP